MSLNTKPAAYQQNNYAYHNLHKQIEKLQQQQKKKKRKYSMAEATVCPLGVRGSQAVPEMFEVTNSSPQCLEKWSHHRCSFCGRQLQLCDYQSQLFQPQSPLHELHYHLDDQRDLVLRSINVPSNRHVLHSINFPHEDREDNRSVWWQLLLLCQ